MGLDWIGLDWIGLDWIGLDWIGLDWIGLDWIGLDWIGLVCYCSHIMKPRVGTSSDFCPIYMLSISMEGIDYCSTGM
jgi:hypothetical protein